MLNMFLPLVSSHPPKFPGKQNLINKSNERNLLFSAVQLLLLSLGAHCAYIYYYFFPVLDWLVQLEAIN